MQRMSTSFSGTGRFHEIYFLKALITLLGSLVECGKLSLNSRDEHDR